MKNILLTIISLFGALAVCNGQTTSKVRNNAISYELGKAGLISNIVFDHRFKAKNYGFKLSIGSNLSQYQSVFQTGGGFYCLKGRGKNYMELGTDLNYYEYSVVSDDQIGVRVLFTEAYTKSMYANLNIGYQYCGDEVFFRTGISLGIMDIGFVPGAYIGLGLKF